MNTRSPQELDAQSPVKIDRWIDVGSQDHKDLDEDRQFTMKLIHMGFDDGGPNDPAWMYTDAKGRIWGHDPRNPEKPHYPLHFDGPRGEKIGYRLPKKAAN